MWPTRLIAAAVILVWVTDANATVRGKATLVANPPAKLFTTDTDYNSGQLASAWSSYVLSLESDDGAKISSLDVKLRGRFNQRWNFNADTEAFDPTPISLNRTNGDSHLILPPTAEIILEPFEDNNVTPSVPVAPDTASRDYGMGTMLQGAWTLPPAEQRSSVDFAYVVIPRGFINLQFDVKYSTDPNHNAPQQTLSSCSFGVECFAPAISVVGGGQNISNGDIARLETGTDFGEVAIGSSQILTLEIRNGGEEFLRLDAPVVTGPFRILGDFPTLVELGGDEFQIELDTTLAGIFAGSITFGTNDVDRNPFTLNLAATVVPEPASGILILTTLVTLLAISSTCSRCLRQ